MELTDESVEMENKNGGRFEKQARFSLNKAQSKLQMDEFKQMQQYDLEWFDQETKINQKVLNSVQPIENKMLGMEKLMNLQEQTLQKIAD